ncbi:hypothetical protein B0H12DRAFT_622397 [Mycena haematopus]|nr:hypothetical protein B0H12DRAFT_622397 [Mycena haematopus]
MRGMARLSYQLCWLHPTATSIYLVPIVAGFVRVHCACIGLCRSLCTRMHHFRQRSPPSPHLIWESNYLTHSDRFRHAFWGLFCRLSSIPCSPIRKLEAGPGRVGMPSIFGCSFSIPCCRRGGHGWSTFASRRITEDYKTEAETSSLSLVKYFFARNHDIQRRRRTRRAAATLNLRAPVGDGGLPRQRQLDIELLFRWSTNSTP